MSNSILDFLIFNQNICQVCKEERTHDIICSTCLERLEFIKGKFILDDIIVFYPMFYNNYLKHIIKEYKFGEKTYLAKPLAAILFKYLLQEGILEKVDYISFIPMEKRQEFKRGYNQVYLIAKELAFLADKQVINLANKIKKTKEQNKLSIEDRKLNLKNAFEPVKNLDIKNKNIIVLDDLVTTGNTLRVFSQTIKETYETNLIFVTLTSSRIGEYDD